MGATYHLVLAILFFLCAWGSEGARQAKALETKAVAYPENPAALGHTCNFSSFIIHEHVTSWEFQLDIPPDKCIAISRDALLASVAAAVEESADHAGVNLTLHHKTLRTSVYDQYSAALTTLDGRPLFPTERTPTLFPWRGPAFIRHRRKHASYPGSHSGVYPNSTQLGVRPGNGDLTIKIKDVNLDAFELLHEQLHFPKCCKKRSCLKWKIENDRYCGIGRPTYEANYHPVRLPHAEISKFEEVERFFPGLWSYFGYPRHSLLPMYNQRFFSKSVWDATVRGVPAVANWIVSYPTLLDALTGGPTGLECELSFRVKRQNAEGAEHSILESALMAVVEACEALHDDGWDTGVHGGSGSGGGGTSGGDGGLSTTFKNSFSH